MTESRVGRVNRESPTPRDAGVSGRERGKEVRNEVTNGPFTGIFPRSSVTPGSSPSCPYGPGLLSLGSLGRCLPRSPRAGRTEDMSREARVRREHGGTGRTTEGNDNMSGRP